MLRRSDWSETSQVALLFGREHGVVRGLAKGAKRERGAFGGGLEPLTRGDVGAIIKPSSELATLTDWSLVEVFWGTRSSSRGFLIGHYIADVIRHAVQDADPHPALWDATLASLRAIEEQERAEGALLRFQWALLGETGYRPDLTAIDEDEEALQRPNGQWAYEAQRGVVVRRTDAAQASDSWALRTETLSVLRALSRDEPGAADASSILRANRFLAACIRWSLGDSPATMARLFGSSSQFGPETRPMRSGG